jgi:hypothetical protein
MSLFGPTVPDRIRASFQFLVDSGRYRLIAESEGIGGAITYRSSELWIAAEWDRSLPWLDFSSTHDAGARFNWSLVDLLLAGADHYEGNGISNVATPEALAEWFRPRLTDIEQRFSHARREKTISSLSLLEQERRRAYEIHLQDVRRQYLESHPSERLSNER